MLNCAKGVRGATFSNIKVYVSVSIDLHRYIVYVYSCMVAREV